MSCYRFTTYSFDTVRNVYLRNSFDFLLYGDSPDVQAAAVSDDLAAIMRLIHISDILVVKVDSYVMQFQNPLWKSIAGFYEKGYELPGTRANPGGDILPAGVGIYVKQSDSSARGRSGRLILKSSIYEADVVSRGSVWRVQSVSLNNAINGIFSGLQKYTVSGNNSNKLVNLHKGLNEPSVVVNNTLGWVNKYRYPRPVLVV